MKRKHCMIALTILLTGSAHAQEVKPAPGQDARAQTILHLNRVYTMPFYAMKDEWLMRRAELRKQILVANGLWPLPEKTPLNAKVFGKIDRGEYTVEKVYFESLPGFYVTGNLYRPSKGTARKPGILNPHGHWGQGRMANEPRGSISGRCISQARMGYVAFSWDMIGYVDSQQVRHNFQGAPLWGLSLMALQTWNSVRSLDFLQSLPDVDPNRIGVTGESGGGTQTFLLTAIDDRVQWAAPVNMISAHMQGGCLCENAPGLRIDTNNMEIAALFAPKPMRMISATGDWTVNTPKIEYPAIREVYNLFGAEDRLSWVQIDAEHNYNQASREAVYGFFSKWIDGKGDGNPIPEPGFSMEAVADLRVFPEGRLPAGAKSPDEITRYWIEQSEGQLEAAKPRSRAGLAKFRTIYEPALRHALAAQIPGSREVTAYETHRVQPAKQFQLNRFFIGRSVVGDRVPALIAVPAMNNGKTSATLFVHAPGKDAMQNGDRYPGRIAKACFESGQIVMSIDAFNTGEAKAEREDRGYFTTYNRTDTAERVQDILTAIVYLRARSDVRIVNLVGLEQFGAVTLFANALAGAAVDRCIVDAAKFNSADDASFVSQLFTPSLRRAGDLRTAMALSAPRSLFIHGTGDSFDTQWARAAYAAAGVARNVRVEQAAAEEDVVSYLTRN